MVGRGGFTPLTAEDCSFCLPPPPKYPVEAIIRLTWQICPPFTIWVVRRFRKAPTDPENSELVLNGPIRHLMSSMRAQLSLGRDKQSESWSSDQDSNHFLPFLKAHWSLLQQKNIAVIQTADPSLLLFITFV